MKEALDYGTMADPDGPVGSPSWRREVEGPYRRMEKNPGRLELLRLAICAFTIVPLRLLLIIVLVFLYCTMASLWLLVTPNRPWAHTVSIFFLRKATRLLLLVMGYWHVRVEGRENIDSSSEPRVFVANHISYIEILFFLAELGPSFVMKRTCLQVPIIGRIATRILDSVSVDNKGGKEGGSGSEAIAKRLDLMFGQETLADWRAGAISDWEDRDVARRDRADHWARGWRGNPLLLFPEGTTSNGSCLLRFKTGVFAGGMPVYPITVQYRYRRFSPAFESILFPVHLFRTLAEPAHHLIVEFLPSYCPTPEQRVDRKAYAKAVQKVFCEALALPPVESGYAEKTKFHMYLRQHYQEHPWGFAAFILPAPDRHDGVTKVARDDTDVGARGSGEANGASRACSPSGGTPDATDSGELTTNQDLRDDIDGPSSRP